MTMAKKHLILTVLLALTIAIAAEAQPGRRGNSSGRGAQFGQQQQGRGAGPMHRQDRGPGGPRLGIFRFLRQLDLTEEQRDVIHDVLESNKAAAEATQEAVHAARQSLHEAVVQEADEEAIRAIAQAMAKAVGDHAIQQVAVTKEIKNVLTEAQKEALASLMSQGPETRQRGPQGRGPRAGAGRGRQMQGQGPEGSGPVRQ